MNEKEHSKDQAPFLTRFDEASRLCFLVKVEEFMVPVKMPSDGVYTYTVMSDEVVEEMARLYIERINYIQKLRNEKDLTVSKAKEKLGEQQNFLFLEFTDGTRHGLEIRMDTEFLEIIQLATYTAEEVQFMQSWYQSM